MKRLACLAGSWISMCCMLLCWAQVGWAQAPKKKTNNPVQGTSLSATWGSAPREYIVQSGDTLWDISRRFLGSPWYWPKLWSKNPHIQNPHWIFPGNRLRFFGPGEIAPARLTKKKKKEWADLAYSKMDGKPEDAGIKVVGKGLISADNLGLNGNKMIVRRESFLDKKSMDESGEIRGSAERRTLLTVGDMVYLKFKNVRNVRTGEKYSIFQKLSPINDPVKGANVGYVIRLYGVVQIVEIRKQMVLARLVEAFQEIQKGYRVTKLISNKVMVKIRRSDALVKGHVLRATVDVELAAQFFQIFINRGKRHGVRKGNVFEIYRRGGPTRNLKTVESRKNLVKHRIGTAVIIDVRLGTSVAVVTQSLTEILIGDEVATSLSN